MLYERISSGSKLSIAIAGETESTIKALYMTFISRDPLRKRMILLLRSAGFSNMQDWQRTSRNFYLR